jgi:hypothetical protein
MVCNTIQHRRSVFYPEGEVMAEGRERFRHTIITPVPLGFLSGFFGSAAGSVYVSNGKLKHPMGHCRKGALLPGQRCGWRCEYRLNALYSRSRLYLWRTTGQSPRIRFKLRPTARPRAVSEPDANLLAARMVNPMKPTK